MEAQSHGCLMNNFARVGADHGDTQHLFSFVVGHHFDDPARIANGSGTRYQRQWDRIAPTWMARLDSLLFSDPQVAMVGFTEQQAVEAGHQWDRIAPTWMARLDSLLFSEPHHGDLRVCENSARNNAMIHWSRRSARKSIVRSDTSVMTPHGSRHLAVGFPANNIASGENVRDVGAEVFVDPDFAVRPGLNACAFDINLV